MKSWIHEISESYVSGHKPVRRDIKENYVHLTEEQRFDLLSENVLNYIDEQLQNAFGFGIGDLSEEQRENLLRNIFETNSSERVVAAMKRDGVDPRESSKRVVAAMKEKGLSWSQANAQEVAKSGPSWSRANAEEVARDKKDKE